MQALLELVLLQQAPPLEQVLLHKQVLLGQVPLLEQALPALPLEQVPPVLHLE